MTTHVVTLQGCMFTLCCVSYMARSDRDLMTSIELPCCTFAAQQCTYEVMLVMQR